MTDPTPYRPTTATTHREHEMSTETTQQPVQAGPADTTQVWGAAQPAERKWSTRKTIAAAAIAVGIAAAGGAAVYAASGAVATNQGGPGGGMGGPPGAGQGQNGVPGGAMRGPMMGGGIFGATTHGEFQTGEVTAISATSIEVTSTDGYVRTYTIDAGTLVNNGNAQVDDITDGASVVVVATTDNGTSTAESIMSGGTGPAGGQDGAPGQPPRGGGN